jgi:molybdate transport system substrate-binding protein
MPAQPASGAAVTALCAGAMHAIVEALAVSFQRTTGVRIASTFTRSGLVRDRVRDGEHVDVVITTAAAVDELARLGKILADSAAAVAHSGIGVAIRTGAAKPEIGSVTAFTSMLRNTASIAYADPLTGSPSGSYLVALFDRLGLSAELSPKTRLVGAAGGRAVVVCEIVAAGEAEIGIQQISEILPVPGVELVGPLPAEVQHMTTFSAAVATGASDPDTARRLVAFLSSAAAASVIRMHGMQPS